MSFQLTRPGFSDKEAWYAIIEAYWPPSSTASVKRYYDAQANYSQLTRAIGDINDSINRAVERIDRSDPGRVGTSNSTHVEEYESYTNSLKGLVETYGDYMNLNSSDLSYLDTHNITVEGVTPEEEAAEEAELAKEVQTVFNAGSAQEAASDFTGWAKSVYLDAVENDGVIDETTIPDYVEGNSVHEATLERIQDTLGEYTSELDTSAVEAMEAGEQQPVLNDFKAVYGDEEGLDKYQDALAIWRGDTAEEVAEETVEEAEEITEVAEEVTPTVTEEAVEEVDELAAAREQAKADLLEAYNAGVIGYDEYLLYSDAVDNWDSGQEVNFDNVLSTFEELKESTIDPYYADYVARSTEQIQSSKDYMEASRELALESENVAAQEKLRSARASLEQAGLTFTGEARRYLGAESAFAQEGEETAVEGLAFGEALEGLIPQESRLISTASEAAYQEQLEALGRETEALLGTTATAELGLATAGDTVGTIAEAQAQTEAGTLSGLYQQQLGNVAQGQYIDFLQ